MTLPADFLHRLADHPLHRFMGVEALTTGDGTAALEITVGDGLTNPAGALHGGVVYTLCDLVGFAALLGSLAEGESAATHDIQVSVLRAATRGERVRFTGRVLKRGREIAFLASEAHAGERLLARATVTKSILRARPAAPAA